MNIQMQICGLIILLCLLYFVIRQKTVGLYTEKVFLWTLLITIVCVSFDIISVVAIHKSAYLGELIVKLICKTYIVTLVWVAFSGLHYVLADIYGENKYEKAVHKPLTLAGLISIFIYVLPIEYVCDGSVVYTQGPSVLLTYFGALLFIVWTVYCVIRFREKMNRRRIAAVSFWMFAWLMAAATQFLNNQLLLVGFASSLGMMILFLVLENPEANVDRSTGCFNSHALLAYIKQCYTREQRFSAILISLSYSAKNDDEYEYMELFFKSLAAFLDKIPNTKVFRNVEQELTVITDDMSAVNEIVRDVEEKFLLAYKLEEEQKLYLLRYIILEDSRLLQNVDEMFPILQYYKKKDAGISEQQIIVIGEDAVTEYTTKDEISQQIALALQEDRVVVYFQPIYSVKEERFVSAEALARIVEKDGSILPPAQFIPVAEETGMIGKLGERVFEKTCEFISKYNLEDYGIEYIEINLSVVQCQNRDLAEKFIQIIKNYQIDPSKINLEITETASVQTKKILLRNMETLMAYGVKFALDDFGNGNSNLDYLIDMPVDILKLDQTMTKAYFNKMKARFVVDAMNSMVHDMGLKIVAEGIETQEQLQAMEELGIDYIQGYYFSRPLPESSFVEFLVSNQK